VELAKDVKSSKESSCKYLSSKTKGKGGMGPLLRGRGAGDTGHGKD